MKEIGEDVERKIFIAKEKVKNLSFMLDCNEIFRYVQSSSKDVLYADELKVKLRRKRSPFDRFI